MAMEQKQKLFEALSCEGGRDLQYLDRPASSNRPALDAKTLLAPDDGFAGGSGIRSAGWEWQRPDSHNSANAEMVEYPKFTWRYFTSPTFDTPFYDFAAQYLFTNNLHPAALKRVCSIAVWWWMTHIPRITSANSTVVQGTTWHTKDGSPVAWCFPAYRHFLSSSSGYAAYQSEISKGTNSNPAEINRLALRAALEAEQLWAADQRLALSRKMGGELAEPMLEAYLAAKSKGLREGLSAEQAEQDANQAAEQAASVAIEEAFEKTVSDEEPTTSFNEKVGFIALGSLVGVGGALLLTRRRQ